MSFGSREVRHRYDTTVVARFKHVLDGVEYRHQLLTLNDEEKEDFPKYCLQITGIKRNGKNTEYNHFSLCVHAARVVNTDKHLLRMAEPFTGSFMDGSFKYDANYIDYFEQIFLDWYKDHECHLHHPPHFARSMLGL